MCCSIVVSGFCLLDAPSRANQQACIDPQQALEEFRVYYYMLNGHAGVGHFATDGMVYESVVSSVSKPSISLPLLLTISLLNIEAPVRVRTSIQ